MPLLRPARAALTAPTLAKVPALTAAFWAAKLLTTGMGESLADFLAKNALWALALCGIALLAALWWQLRSDRYRAVTYWTAVAMVAVVGTVAADGVRLVGVPLPVITAAYAAALVVVLALWRRSEGTLSIHSITNRRRELYYWLVVMISFALGTAAGDLTAFYLGWGFGISAVLFAAGMIVPWVLCRARVLNEVAAFWTAYAMTRPLGATIADWLGKPAGLGFGDGLVALVELALAALVVAYFAVTKSDLQGAERPRTEPLVAETDDEIVSTPA